MKTKTHFAFRVDIWDAAGDSILEHVNRAAVALWPVARITLRQGARVVHESGRPHNRTGRAPEIRILQLHTVLRFRLSGEQTSPYRIAVAAIFQSRWIPVEL